MQDNNNITASIVIYKNDLRLLKQAVKSFLESTTNSVLYLIDNSPTNEAEKHFRDPRIDYTFNNKNLGFGAAHNIALKKVLSNPGNKYHIILNPDVYFEKHVPNNLFKYMESNRQVGLVMPKVLYPDGRLQHVCKLLPSPLTLFSRRFLQFSPSIVNELNHWYEMHFSGYDKEMDVPFLSGCFMFLRLNTLREIGLFDERIFLYTEDTDLTRRIHRYYRTVFYPGEQIFHYNQRGSYRSLLILTYHILSAIKYFNKWGWFYDDERRYINEKILLKFSQ
jgi:GT2 family glycosyltransferase